MTLATWLPKSPRYVCSSSMTTNCRFSKSLNHFVWCGRIAEWSMSGFVITTCPAARTTLRTFAGVSPS